MLLKQTASPLLLFFLTLLLYSCQYECEFDTIDNGIQISAYEADIRESIQATFKNVDLSLNDTLKARLLYIDQINSKNEYSEAFLAKNAEIINDLCVSIAQNKMMGTQVEAEEVYNRVLDQLIKFNREDQCELPADLIQKPINDKRKAVVSIGANSFDGFVISIDRNKAWSNVEEYYGESLGLELGIDYALYKLEQTMERIISEQGVSVKDILVVFSSGLEEINEEAVQIKRGLESRGYRVQNLSCDEEARYGFSANILKNYENRSFFLDIGSGNTKVAWKNQTGTIETFCAEGSLYKQRLVTDEAALASFDGLRIPAQRTEYCFITGGGPYKLAELKGLNTSKNKFFCFPELSTYNTDDLGYGQLQASKDFLEKIQKEHGVKHFVFISDSNYSIGKLLELDY